MGTGISFLFIVESNYKLLETGKYDAVDTNPPDDDHSEDVKKDF